MGILLDIGFVIIILLCVVFGYKIGFFKSIAGFIGAVIAMFLAWVLAGLIANALYQGVFREKLIDNISSVLSNDALASFPEKAAQGGFTDLFLPGDQQVALPGNPKSMHHRAEQLPGRRPICIVHSVSSVPLPRQ